MGAYRQPMNNSTFENEQDIGRAVYDWTVDYNKKHIIKTSIISLQEERPYVFAQLLIYAFLGTFYLKTHFQSIQHT